MRSYCWQLIILTYQEILNEQSNLYISCNGSQLMLKMLKDKGAPVLGSIHLEFDHKNYDFMTTKCFDKGIDQFEFYYKRKTTYEVA